MTIQRVVSAAGRPYGARMRLNRLRRALDMVLGSTDTEAVTRRLRESIATYRSAPSFEAGQTRRRSLFALLGGREQSESVIRRIGARRPRR